MTPMYIFVLCNLFEVASLSKYIKVRQIPKVFAFFGIFTLELYRVSSSFERLLTNDACPEHHFLYVLLYFVLSTILAYICSILFKRVNNLIYTKLKTVIL